MWQPAIPLGSTVLTMSSKCYALQFSGRIADAASFTLALELNNGEEIMVQRSEAATPVAPSTPSSCSR